MNCFAPSVASLIVGLVVGFIAMASVIGVVTVAVHKNLATDELKRLRKIAKAALSLLEDERVAACIPEDAPEDAPTETYEIPADVWERFEKAIDESEAS